VQFVGNGWGNTTLDQLQRAGKFLSFLFLVCGAARLARFNIQKNPIPKNPGSPDRKYFVGLPIPAAAGMIAAVVFVADSYPVTSFYESVIWLGLLALLSFLMVSTWRYWSFKELNLLRPRSPILLVMAGCAIYVIWNWSQPVLLVLASAYVASGILTRAGGIIRRNFRAKPRSASPSEPKENPVV
jgi:CDP-diacylglycerol--serine O-phosphatidyltransferase